MIKETIKKMSSLKVLKETKTLVEKESKVLELRRILGNPLNVEELKEYNHLLTIGSDSKYDEINFKRYLLRTRGEIFSKEEYIKWSNYIKDLSLNGMKDELKEQIINPFSKETLKKANEGFIRRNCELIKTPLPEQLIKELMIYGNADIFTTEEINELLELTKNKTKHL